MLQRAIEAAQKSNIFDRIIVSTDSIKIAREAEKNGVEVPFMRQAAQDDYATVSEATIVAIQQASAYYDEEYLGSYAVEYKYNYKGYDQATLLFYEDVLYSEELFKYDSKKNVVA